MGLNQKQYCIFNKQYSPEEYRSKRGIVIEHVKRTGEWGHSFPVDLSPFPYNDSVAQEYFALKQSEVLSLGWRWEEPVESMHSGENYLEAERLPDSIDSVRDDVLQTTVLCMASKRPFRLQPFELRFCRWMHLALPRLHPDLRYSKRLQMRNRRSLRTTNCRQCGVPVRTSYEPCSTLAVLCQTCYENSLG